ncbi:MAG: glutamate--tRNA ligase [Betaproteobacteria bacterium]|nr:glutamate--tRNA ligase [Betaproteobacteria bacterium]
MRTRFAPSPTGGLHLGGARTALYCWAHARRCRGEFLLRIEDTDQSRSRPEFERSIIESLEWLGLQPDEEPLRQSQRGEHYQAAAEQLLEEGHAYRCYATVEELTQLRNEQIARGEKPRYDRRWRDSSDPAPAGRSHVLRFATPLEGSAVIDDVIRGRVEVANRELDDPVIVRADGSPTYNFACVVDDLACQITDVIRGEDHLSNSLRQLHIASALGAKPVRHAHLPLIMAAAVDDDGQLRIDEAGNTIYEKMSKRNCAVDLAVWREEGYLPEAMINYLAQLGWTNSEREVYGSKELSEKFELARVHKSAARFDPERLKWLNRQHLRSLPAAEISRLAGVAAPDAAIELACEQAHTITELQTELSYFSEDAQIPLAAFAKHAPQERRAAIAQFAGKLAGLESFSADAIKKELTACCQSQQLKFRQLAMPLRTALTGRENTPDICLIASLLGKSQVGLRLQRALQSATEGAQPD